MSSNVRTKTLNYSVFAADTFKKIITATFDGGTLEIFKKKQWTQGKKGRIIKVNHLLI